MFETLNCVSTCFMSTVTSSFLLLQSKFYCLWIGIFSSSWTFSAHETLLIYTQQEAKASWRNDWLVHYLFLVLSIVFCASAWWRMWILKWSPECVLSHLAKGSVCEGRCDHSCQEGGIRRSPSARSASACGEGNYSCVLTSLLEAILGCSRV